MSIRLNLEGFEEAIKKLEKGGKSIDKITENLAYDQAQIAATSFMEAASRAKIDAKLTPPLPKIIEREGNVWKVKVGYYKPENYSITGNPDFIQKLILLNYGTPNRKKHGQVEARGFIRKAKNNAKKKFEKGYKNAFVKMVEEIQK